MSLISRLKLNANLVDDEMLGASAWTASNLTLDTTTKKFGAGAMKATNAAGDGSSASTAASISAMEGSGLAAFKIAGWIQRAAGTAGPLWSLDVGNATLGELGVQLILQAVTGFGFGASPRVYQHNTQVYGPDVTLQASIDANWHYFEWSFSGTQHRVFWDGVAKLTQSDSDKAIVDDATPIKMQWNLTPAGADIRLDNFEFWNEVGHTADYTPPATEDEGFFTALSGNIINGSVALAALQSSSAPLASNLIQRAVILGAMQPEFTRIEANIITHPVFLSQPADGVFDLAGMIHMHSVIFGGLVPSRYPVIGMENATSLIKAQAQVERIGAEIHRAGIKAQADA